MSYRTLQADAIHHLATEPARQSATRLDRSRKQADLNATFGSVEDIEGPTPYRLARGDVLRPELNQKVKRERYRSQDEFDRLHGQGTLDPAEYNAADKLRRHWLGAQGHNVSNGEGGADPVEHPRTYHAQMVAAAELAVTPRQWEALTWCLTERGTIEAMGGVLCHRKHPQQARAAAMELLKNALDHLAIYWGFAERQKPPRTY